MKVILNIIGLIFCTCFAEGQGWEKIYQDFSIQQSLKVVHAGDGGYLVLAQNNYNDTYLLKINESGEEIWERKYENIYPSSMVATEDGGYAIVSFNVNGEEPTFIFKVNEIGETIWESALFNQGLGYDKELIYSIVETEEMGYIITGTIDIDPDPDFIQRVLYIAKVDNEGNIIYENIYEGNSITGGYDIVRTSDNHFAITGSYNGLIKIDSDGNIIWEQYIRSTTPSGDTLGGYFSALNETQDKGFICGGTVNEDIGTSKKDIFIVRTDSLGNLIWSKTIGELNETEFTFDIIQARDGSFLLASSGNNYLTDLIKIDNQGNTIWERPSSVENLPNSVIQTQDDGFLIAASHNIDIYIIKTDTLGHSFTNQIQGNIWYDSQEDCIQTAEEVSLESWMVEAKKEDRVFYATTDSLGYYDMIVDTGDYVVNVIRPNIYWEVCEDSVYISFTDFFDARQVDHPMQVVVDCALLEVDISTPYLRRCYDNNYTVQYCNRGTILAENSYVIVNFDEYLTVNGSTLPFTNTENIYTFEIGDVDVGECSTFQVNVTVDCDSTVLGQTHCVEAHIFPDSLCLPLDLNWDQANIEVSGECIGDSLQFIIENTGVGNMNQQNEFIIVIDDIIMRTGDYQLDSGEPQIEMVPANGETFRLQTSQTTGHPIGNMPTVAIEGCNAESPDSIHISFVTQFPEDDDGPFVSIDCEQNIGSYDPNDKQAYPKGVHEAHFIEQNIDIEYKIRFQNTGTDTAFRVVVIDTIAEFLEPTSIVPGASSHPYTFELYGYGVVKFTFENILLVDSTTNEVGSHGFIKFRIDQKQDNPLGTIIENSASIYFDYNAPIKTNTTFHTVGEEFLALISGTSESAFENTSLSVYPNPVENVVTFQLEGIENAKQIELNLYDMTGRLMRTETHNSSTFNFSRGTLSSGIYFFSIKTEKGEVNSGKLLIH